MKGLIDEVFFTKDIGFLENGELFVLGEWMI